MGIYLRKLSQVPTVIGGLAVVATNQRTVYHFLQISVHFNFFASYGFEFVLYISISHVSHFYYITYT